MTSMRKRKLNKEGKPRIYQYAEAFRGESDIIEIYRNALEEIFNIGRNNFDFDHVVCIANEALNAADAASNIDPVGIDTPTRVDDMKNVTFDDLKTDKRTLEEMKRDFLKDVIEHSEILKNRTTTIEVVKWPKL